MHRCDALVAIRIAALWMSSKHSLSPKPYRSVTNTGKREISTKKISPWSLTSGVAPALYIVFKYDQQSKTYGGDSRDPPYKTGLYSQFMSGTNAAPMYVHMHVYARVYVHNDVSIVSCTQQISVDSQARIHRMTAQSHCKASKETKKVAWPIFFLYDFF